MIYFAEFFAGYTLLSCRIIFVIIIWTGFVCQLAIIPYGNIVTVNIKSGTKTDNRRVVTFLHCILYFYIFFYWSVQICIYIFLNFAITI